MLGTRSLVETKGRLGVLFLVVLLFASACGSGDGVADPGASETGPTVVSNPSGSDGLALVEEARASLPVVEGTPAEQIVEGQRLLRQQMVDELGLAAVLTPEVFAAGDLLASQIVEGFTSLAPEATGESGSGGGFVLAVAPRNAGWFQQAPVLSGLNTVPSWASSAMSGIWYDARTPGDVSSEPKSDSRTKENNGITSTMEVSVRKQGGQIVAEVTDTTTYTVDGESYKAVTHVSVTADACPDADGVLKVTYAIEYQLTGGKTVTHTASGTATGRVGDDALLKSVDLEGKYDNGSGSPIGSSFTESVTQTPPDENHNEKVGHLSLQTPENLAGEQLTGFEGKSDLDGVSWALMNFLIVEPFVEDIFQHAQDSWLQGGCVAIVVPEGIDHKLKARESKTFTARVDHKWEGGDLPLPVSGELAGDGTLAPGRIDPAPDTFVMTAGIGRYDNVYLETVSRRGRDTETVHFEVESPNITAAFTGTLDYDFPGLAIHGDVRIPAITLEPDSGGVYEGSGPVELDLSMEVPGCGTATGTQEGGEITLTGKLQTRDGNLVLTFLAEESEGGDLSMSCPQASVIGGGGFGAGAAGLINLGRIAIPLDEGTYQFRNEDTTSGAHFVVQGEVTLTIPSG